MGRHPPDPARHRPSKAPAPPDPGREAAPDATTQGVDPHVAPRDGGLDRVAGSSMGPGAGESDLVRVTTPRDVPDKDIAHHPSLRSTRSARDKQSARDK